MTGCEKKLTIDVFNTLESSRRLVTLIKFMNDFQTWGAVNMLEARAAI